MVLSDLCTGVHLLSRYSNHSSNFDTDSETPERLGLHVHVIQHAHANCQDLEGGRIAIDRPQIFRAADELVMQCR